MTTHTLQINATDDLAVDGTPHSLFLDGFDTNIAIAPTVGVTMTVVLTATQHRSLQPVVNVMT